MTGTHTNTITPVSRGMRNTFRVDILGFFGKGTFYRRNLPDAIATARRYARMFDAPANPQVK